LNFRFFGGGAITVIANHAITKTRVDSATRLNAIELVGELSSKLLTIV